MLTLDPNDRAIFEPFNIHSTSYKKVHNHPIAVDILYPTRLLDDVKALSSPRPLIIRFHGGGLIAGASLFAGFFSTWLLDLALKHGATIVSADYQLLPESSPADILSDVSDMWDWVQTSLATYLAHETQRRLKVDLSKILTTGDSAGGLLSLLLALTQPEGIKATLAQYPMVDLRSAHFTQAYDKKPFGMPIEQFPKSLIDELSVAASEYKVSTGSKLVVSGDPSLSRIPAMFSALQHGVLGQLIRDGPGGENILVFERLRRGQRFPAGGVFLLHGTEDSVVPLQGSHELVKIARESDPDVKIRLDVQPGEHGFDIETRLTDHWISDIVKEIEPAWLS